MNPTGYYWCDNCDDSASALLCEHCGHSARWIHVPLHHVAPQQSGPVSLARGRELFAQLRWRLGGDPHD